jgi:hypothetical protein
MKIIWNENPLLTQIMLDEHEKKEFWYKIKIEELQNLMTSAYFHLEEDKDFFDIKRAKEDLEPKYFYPDWNDSSKKGQKSDLDKRVDELYEYYIADLEQNPHCGDCTCVACSCSKCHAEGLLGLDTIKGLRKHEASKIDGAFTLEGEKFPTREKQRTIGEAIERLKQYVPTNAWEGAELHFERWIEEAINATKWLEKYRNEHFSS